MVDVSFEIRHRKSQRVIATVSAQLKESYDELSGDDLLFITKQMENSVDEQQLKLLLLHKWSNLRNQDFALLKENESGLVALMDAIPLNLDNIVSRHNPLRGFSYNGMEFKGPDPGLENIRLFQFACAESFFFLYSDTQEEKWLSLLTEVLFLPVSLEKFDGNLVDQEKPYFEKLASHYKFAVFIAYGAMRKYFFNLYNGTSEDSDEKSSKKVKFDHEMYERLIIDLSGTKFGDDQKTGDTHIHRIFTYLKMLEERADAA